MNDTMPLSALVKTHEQCKKCHVWVPSKYLSCPSCLGFAKKNEQWSQPAKAKVKRQPVQEPSMFDVSHGDYPA